MLWTVLKEALVLTAAGLVAGCVITFGVTRLIASQLFGVTPYNPTTTAAACGLLFIVALAASYLPARRAAKADPLVALRYE